MSATEATVISLSDELNRRMYGPIEQEIGVFHDVPFETYSRWSAASQSMLGYLAPPSTPAHAKAYMDAPSLKTPALILGDAIHKAILEPEIFASRYVVAIEGDGRTNAVKEARAAQAREFPNATIITPADFNCANAVRESVMRHPAARALIELAAERELSMCWLDDATGEKCKGRIDITAPDISTIVDLKSTINASRDAFARSIVKYGYHRQGAMYLNGYEAVGVVTELPPCTDYVFIAFEKVPPFAVAVYRLSSRALMSGATENAHLMALYAKCLREDRWPAYSEDIEDIDIPAPFVGADHFMETV